jgi:hypothetical protein
MLLTTWLLLAGSMVALSTIVLALRPVRANDAFTI